MRKEKNVTVTLENRDKGKVFHIQEMSARKAEQWADRAFLALSHSALNLPPGIENLRGMEGIIKIGQLIGHVQYPEIAPLTDELMHCITFCPQPDKPHIRIELQDLGIEGDTIEDVATRQFLREEVMSLHTNFSLAAVILNLIAAASDQTKILDMTSKNTSTSPSTSE